jgi:hypothetical protein
MEAPEIQSRIDRLDGFYQALKGQEKALTDEVTNLKKDVDLYTKASAVIKILLDTMVRDEINKMAGLVTYGLKAIFEDQDLSFKPVISKKNDRIYIELKTANNGRRGIWILRGQCSSNREFFTSSYLYVKNEYGSSYFIGRDLCCHRWGLYSKRQ